MNTKYINDFLTLGIIDNELLTFYGTLPEDGISIEPYLQYKEIISEDSDI